MMSKGSHRIRLDESAVRERIVQRMEKGDLLPGGQLPGTKALAVQVKASEALVRRALRALEDAGRIERTGRAWRTVRAGAPRSGRLRLVALAQNDGIGPLLVRTTREEDFWRDLARECVQWGLELEILPFQSYGPYARLPEIVRENLAGIVLSTLHLSGVEEIIRTLSQARVPLAVWTESLQSVALQGKRTLFCDLGQSHHAGRAMGRHLKEKSISHAVWISPFDAAPWSHERQEGLRAGLGPQARIDKFCHSNVSDWDFRPGPGEVVALFEPALPDWIPSFPAQEEMAKESVSRRLNSVLLPSFEVALRTGAPAWVLANDQCALLARNWLTRHGGSRMPILCGFDDLFESMRQGLVSYRFPTTEMVRAMVAHCLDPRARTRRLALTGIVVRG
jgi:hypothetical protein